MRPQRASRCRHRAADERGVALAAAVAVAVVVVLLSMTALRQSVSSMSQSGIAAKQVSSTDAAEAGLQYLEDQMSVQASSQATSFTCPSTTALASGGPFTATYSLAVAAVGGSSTPTVPTTSPVACTGQSMPLQGGTTYLIQSTGTTTAGVIGSKTVQSLVYVPAAKSYAAPGYWHDALFAGVDVLGGGSFKLTGGDAYSGSVGLCASNWSFGGNYFSNGAPILSGVLPITVTAPTAFAGACSVSGNLYMNNALGIAITAGSGVGGTVYSAGPASIGGGAGVGGDVDADGAVILSGGGTVSGNVASGDPLLGVTTSGGVTVSGSVSSSGPVTGTGGTFGGSISAQGAVTLTSSTVAGDIHAAGAVTLTSGTYRGNVYAGGPVTVQGGATVTGKIYAAGGVSILNGTVGTVEDQGGTILYTARASGPLYETGALVIPSALGSGPTATIPSLPADYPTSFALSLPNVGSIVTTALATAASTVEGAAQSTATVTEPVLNFDQQAWLANSGFCGSTTCTTSSVNFVTDNDCNVSAQSGSTTVLDPNSVWAVVAAMGVTGAKPTVLQTDCQFTWGDSYLKGSTLKLAANLAIFDSAGFNFSSSMTGVVSAPGTGSHQFYAIVPSSAYNILPAVLSLLSPASYPAGESSCSLLTGPDIIVNAPLTDSGDNVADFLYTPASICTTAGNATVYGRAYAGQTFFASSNWNQTFAAISPFDVVSGSGSPSTTPGTPQVQWVRQAAATSP